MTKWVTMQKVNKKLDKGENSNKNMGSTIILVIVAVAFVSMLVAILTYMTYYNFLMKNTDESSKNNFYTAESALDEIVAGLQDEVSKAMAEGYVVALQNSTDIVDSGKEGDTQTEISEERFVATK